MKQTIQATTRIHMGLNTRRFQQSVQFYRTFFDVQPVKVKPGYAKFEVANPPLNLAITEADRVDGNRVSHFGVQVDSTEAVQAQADRLRRQGLEPEMEENTVCCYARQDKVWVRDPDGNAWETFVVHEDAEEKACDPQEKVGCAC